MRNLREYIRQGVEPFLPDTMLPDGGIRGLPDWACGVEQVAFVLLECRLADRHQALDVSWACAPERLRVPTELRHQFPWSSIDRLSAGRAAGEPELAPIHLVGFEVDDCHDRAAAPPAMFFMMDHVERPAYATVVRRLCRDFCMVLSVEADETLQRTVRLAPRGAILPYIGLMISRARMPLRIGIERIESPYLLISYLDALGWHGDHGEIAAFLEAMAMRFPGLRPILALDILDTVQPRIGLEYIFGEKEPGAGTRAAGVLDFLVEKGLCSRDKRDALLSWPGTSTGVEPPVARFLSGGLDCFHRRLSHLKVVFDPGGVSVKGYLECSHTHVRLPHARMQGSPVHHSPTGPDHAILPSH